MIRLGTASGQLEAVLRSARYLEKLSRDLMEASRLAAVKPAVQAEPIDPRALLEDAISALRPPGAEKLIVVACTCSRSVPRVLADRDRVYQVFSTLVGNAIKFTPAGGRVVIAPQRLPP